MDDSKQKNDFSNRVQRINEKRGTPSEQSSKKRHWEDSLDDKAKSGKSNFLNIFIWILIIGGIGGAGAYGAHSVMKGNSFSVANFKEASAALITDITQPKDLITGQPARSQNAPPLDRELTEQGWKLHSPAVATADRNEVVMADLTIGFEDVSPEVGPAKLLPFDTNEDCTLRRPLVGEVLHNVRLERGTDSSAVHAFSKTQISKALIEHIDGVRSKKAGYKVGSRASGQLSQVDVFVTDKSGPVYLVLQSFGGSVIWNINIADGVRLDHVSMIGNNSGLVKPQVGVSFEALRISDFVEYIEFGSNDTIQPCMIAPWRQPQEHWPAYQKAQNNNTLFENQMYSYNAGYRAFNAWFSEVLGFDAGTNLTTAVGAAHVLVGPVPDIPIHYEPISGRDVYITRNDYMLIGDDAFEAVHDALLTSAAGGDLALLNPAPMGRVEQ